LFGSEVEPDLKRGKTFAILQLVGKMHFRIERFIISTKIGISANLNNFMNFTGIPSLPVAFLGHNSFIRSEALFSVTIGIEKTFSVYYTFLPLSRSLHC
jgi:hypothetical protein